MKPKWEFLNIYNNPEHDLFDSVNMEYADISGFPIKYYIKIESDNVDDLYGEDTTSEFSSTGYDSKLVYEPEEEISVMDVFGFSPEDALQYGMMPKTMFTRDIAIPYGDNTLKPMVGDVIITLWNNKKYEVTYIGSEQSIFLGKKMIWEFTLTPYRHSEESDSADVILNYEPGEDNFPDINDQGIVTKPLSGYGENQWIEDASDEIDTVSDSDVYGY